MVKETRITFSINDIKAVHFKCTNCNGEVTVKLKDPRNMPGECPLCQHRWVDNEDMPRKVWNVLRTAFKKETKETTAILLFEIDGEQEKES